MNDETPPPYVYRCEDRSVLLETYKRTVVPLWRWWVPSGLPANMITLGSSACMWVVCGLSLNASSFSPTTLALAFLALTQGYLAYDHIDGMQAKATGTSSALGEYFDHALDTYHGAILTLSTFALLGAPPLAVLLVLLSAGFVAFAATMVEQKERGELFFGWFGTLESMLLFFCFYGSCLVPEVRAWWTAPLYAGWPAYWILIGAGGLGCIGTAADCLRRIGRVPVALAVFVGLNLILAVALGKSSAPQGWLIAAMFLHGGDYVGRVIGSHLLRRPNVWPDFAAPVLAVAGLFGPSWILAVLLAWLGVRWSWGVYRVVWPLRGDWRWKNPPARTG